MITNNVCTFEPSNNLAFDALDASDDGRSVRPRMYVHRLYHE